MELASVRALKAELQETNIAPLALRLVAELALDVPAGHKRAQAPYPTGIAVGVSGKGGSGFRLALRTQNRTGAVLEEVERINELARGEVDLRHIGPIRKRQPPWHRSRNRPLKIGGSIGHHIITAGTLGCFVRDGEASDRTLVLSNNHVLADENNGSIGDAILQPGDFDHGQNPGDKVGELLRFVPMETGQPNRVDCAVATIDDPLSFEAGNLTGLGSLSGLGQPIESDGVQVSKIGRTTGLTHGVVTAFEVDNVIVEYDMGLLRFDGQIEIEGAGDDPFSRGGDSGSMIVDDNLAAVALLFAGGESGGTNGQGLTYANPLHEVLDAINVQLVESAHGGVPGSG